MIYVLEKAGGEIATISTRLKHNSSMDAAMNDTIFTEKHTEAQALIDDDAQYVAWKSIGDIAARVVAESLDKMPASEAKK